MLPLLALCQILGGEGQALIGFLVAKATLEPAGHVQSVSR